MEKLILKELADMAQERHIKILHACEVGGRAWGFASEDADFDVKIIYAHQENWYLSITDKKDTIEGFTNTPNGEEVDFLGWDIRKFLNMVGKSYCPAFEWIYSPIVYTQETDLSYDLKKIAPQYFNLRQGLNHYLAITRSTLQSDLREDKPKVKRYFYALRALLAAGWVAEKQTIPPVNLQILLPLIEDSAITKVVEQLLVEKLQSEEAIRVERNVMLNDYIESQILEYEAFVPSLMRNDSVSIEPLNELFRKIVRNF